ncbi:large ribosomal subunit protein uL2m-like [Styela clava]|uniref:39S ribosomal protein L2, mitochondrial-like n=1 Tax=Styela clava TaxID=7725 RepID=UPI00193A4FD3|nr:39S ribosomal protein L2, mitochondrial-like [Styela clava]
MALIFTQGSKLLLRHVCLTASLSHKIQTENYHLSSCNNGRYGHRLVKLWEQKGKYTAEPIKVWRTGGRLPMGPDKLPGTKWTAKIGGGLPRQFFWVQHKRLTKSDVENELLYFERVMLIKEDDNRSGYIALVGGPMIRRWILATDEMKVGDVVKNCAKLEAGVFNGKSGDAYPLKLIPTGTNVCSVEMYPGKGAKLSRSAGNTCKLLRKTQDTAILQLPSGREVSVHQDCVAVIGRVSNIEHEDEIWGSAERKFEYGMRPGSGLWHRKDGRHGRKIHPKKPMVVYDQAKVLKQKKSLED